MLPSGLFPGHDQLTATMVASREPVATNGHWNSEEQKIEWTVAIEGYGSDKAYASLPDIVYAIWAEPQVVKQTELFGKVVLADEQLATYCLWRRGLTNEMASQWEEFLVTLSPHATLADVIRTFRFRDETPEGYPPAQEIRDLLADSVK
jgi:hypothetical protein